MKTTIKLLVLTAGFLTLLSPAQAHHSIAAIFNQGQQMTITGEVVEFEFVNPHANLRLKVIDENGNAEVWDIEMDGRLNLTNGNFTPKTFIPGETLTVLGFPPHVKSPNLFFLSATRPDGTKVLPPREQIRNALEEERRLRREQQALSQTSR